MTVEKLFSYGTLQYEKVQISLFGRKLNGTKDALMGYKLCTVQITDPKVIELSGESIHKILKFTNNTVDVVEGMVFDLTPQELQLSDSYEVADYKRISVRLRSGIKAWLYASYDTEVNEAIVEFESMKELSENKHTEGS